MKARLIALCLLVSPLLAAQEKKPLPKDAPKLLYVVPLTVVAGQKEKLIVRGLQCENVTDWKANDPAIKIKSLGKPRNSKGPNNYPTERCGDWECELELEVPKAFSATTLELTASGAKGSSEPLKIAVQGQPRVVEKEPNDGFTQAQELQLPAQIEGTINRERDVDVFRFLGRTNEKVQIEILAAQWGSPVDGILTVYDSQKRVLASCDDVNGSSDPMLTLTLPRDGVYFVSLLDAHDAGGSMFPYRLVVKVQK